MSSIIEEEFTVKTIKNIRMEIETNWHKKRDSFIKDLCDIYIIYGSTEAEKSLFQVNWNFYYNQLEKDLKEIRFFNIDFNFYISSKMIDKTRFPEKEEKKEIWPIDFDYELMILSCLESCYGKIELMIHTFNSRNQILLESKWICEESKKYYNEKGIFYSVGSYNRRLQEKKRNEIKDLANVPILFFKKK